MGNWAFFSYARADSAVAEKLHAALDRYRAPSDLVGTDGANGPVPKTLHPVFRDVSDLSGGGHLNDKIQLALADSTCLVVLCSPAAAASPWVNIECETFIAQGKAARIFPVIAPDLPAAGERDEKFEETFFPPALRGKGFLAADLRETVAASSKPVGDGEDNGRMKLIAGLLGVPLDALIKREQRRQRRLVAMLGGAALVFAGVAAAAVVQTFAANVQRARAVAGESLAEERAAAEAQARAEAEQNALEREEQRRLAETQRQLADRNAEEARIQELAAVANAREASTQRDNARAALARTFAERGWAALRVGDRDLAARYALAGWRTSPGNVESYRSVLANVMQFAPTRTPASETAPASNASPRSDALRTALARSAPAEDFSYPEFSQDGRYLARATESGVEIWGVDGMVHSFPTPGFAHVGFSQDGNHLVAAAGGRAQVWEVATRQEDSAFAVPEDISQASFCGSDGLVLLTTYSSRIIIWNTRTNRLQTLVGNQYPDDTYVQDYHAEMDPSELVGAACNPDGSRVATEAQNGMVWIWDTADGRKLEILRYVNGIQGFSADGRALLLRNAVVNVTQGRETVRLPGHTAPLTVAFFTQDSRRVVTLSQDGTARVWIAQTGELQYTLNHRAPIVGGNISGEDARLALVGGNALSEWNLATGQPIRRIQVRGAVDAYYTADRSRIIVDSETGPFRVFNTLTGAETEDGLYARLAGAFQARYQYRGSIAAGTRDGRYRLYELSGVTYIIANDGDNRESNDRTVQTIVHSDVTSADFSPDGALILTAGRLGLRLWEFGSGREVAAFDPRLPSAGSAEQGVTFSPDGSRIVVIGSASNEAAIWDVASLTAPMDTLAKEACARLLEPKARRFRERDIEVDPLIREVWLRDGRPIDRDVCEGVPGARLR